MPKTLFILLGPTGVGKTALSLELAEYLHSPILNCDSRQLFRGIEIGTAAPTPAQLARVPHYFVGTLALDEYYSAARYEQEALDCLTTLFATHDNLLLSGGSMLYIDAVCKGIDDIPTVDEHTRQHLKQRLETEGLASLCQELSQLDPAYYALVDKCNTRRVVHALEICLMTGQTYTSFRQRKTANRPFRIVKIGLLRPREELFARINQRVEEMMQEGLLDEVRHHLPHRSLNALNTVGYKELFAYLDGTFDSLQTAVERIKKNTRVYAKKQLTWFCKDSEIQWFHPDDKAAILDYVAAHQS